MPPKRRWDELTTEEISAGDVSGWVAVLPIAATEQHGPHLPLGTDTMIGEGLLGLALETLPDDLPVTILPTLPYGKSDEHRAFPGTLSLSAATLTALLVEIGASLARAGISRLLILSSHGGNSEAMSVAGRTLRLDHSMLVVATNWMRLGQPEGLFGAGELKHGAGSSPISPPPGKRWPNGMRSSAAPAGRACPGRSRTSIPQVRWAQRLPPARRRGMRRPTIRRRA